MKDIINIISVTNAGVVISNGHTGLLVDGLYEETPPFPPMPDYLAEDLLQGRQPGGKVDFLLFTHLHGDHFSIGKILPYLDHNSLKGMVFPWEYTVFDKLEAPLAKHKTASYPLMLARGAGRQISLCDGLTIRAWNTGHMGSQFTAVDHYSFFINLGEQNILVTGDSDFDEEGFRQMIGGQPVDMALVNPLFLHNPKGARILETVIRPRAVVIYHIPYRGDDVMVLRALTKRLLQKHATAPYRLFALEEPLQMFSFQ